MVVLPDPFRGTGAWRNSTEAQQSGHAPRSGPEIINRSGAENGAPERIGLGTVKEEVSQILLSVLSCIGKRTKEGCDRGSKVETIHSG